LVRIFKRRAARVYATGTAAAPAAAGVPREAAAPTAAAPEAATPVAAAAAAVLKEAAATPEVAAATKATANTQTPEVAKGGCRGAVFNLTLAQAELWAWEHHTTQLQGAGPPCLLQQATLQDVEWAASVVSL